MEVDIIGKVAGETEEKVSERKAILRRLEILEKGLRLCKEYATRPQSGKRLRQILSLDYR